MAYRKAVFVNSMSDLFHQDVPREFIARVFAIMAMTKEHTFQILTKRADRLSLLSDEMFELEVGLIVDEYARERGWCVDLEEWPLPNVWLGVSVENQQAANERIPHLLQTPAAIRWVSAEPLLGPLCLDAPQDCWLAEFTDQEMRSASPINPPRIDWVVTGGESGPNARPSHPDWIRGLRDQCVEAKVPFFFKQWGEIISLDQAAQSGIEIRAIDAMNAGSLGRGFIHLGKKKAGRLLDGRTWDEMPRIRIAG